MREHLHGTRPAIARLAAIKAAILAGPARGQMLNAHTLARDMECNPRTIHRDLTFMRDRLGHDIAYNPSTWTLYYVTPPQPVL